MDLPIKVWIKWWICPSFFVALPGRVYGPFVAIVAITGHAPWPGSQVRIHHGVGPLDGPRGSLSQRGHGNWEKTWKNPLEMEVLMENPIENLKDLSRCMAGIIYRDIAWEMMIGGYLPKTPGGFGWFWTKIHWLCRLFRSSGDAYNLCGATPVSQCA